MVAIVRTMTRSKIMPYAFKVAAIMYPICKEWCIEEFGYPKGFDKGRWSFRCNEYYKRLDRTIYFMNEEDAVAFKIRWL